MKKTSRKDAVPNKKETPKQQGCSFTWDKLIKMKENKTQFFAGDGFKRLQILDIDQKTKNIHMVCELGKKTWPLSFAKLEELHQLVHDGKIKLIPYEIDRLMPTWGNFITGLFKHLGCNRPD